MSVPKHRIIGDDPAWPGNSETIHPQFPDNSPERNPDWPVPLSAWDWLVGAVVWGVAMVVWGMLS